MAADAKTLLNASGDNLEPEAIWNTMFKNEKPGGHGERSVAIGTIDMAIWDATAKIAGKPLFQLLADAQGRTANPKVFVYAAGGYYYPGKDIEKLKAEMQSYLDRGYTVVKMKIGGAPLAQDIARIEAVLGLLPAGCQLAVDANGRFDKATALAYGEALSAYDLFWYEEAGDPLDYELQAELSQRYAKPMATGENLFSMQDARNLIRHGGMRKDIDWLQFDCALAYGLVEYQRTLKMLDDMAGRRRAAFRMAGIRCRWPSPPGSAWAATRSYPDLFQPYGGFPDGVRVENGHVTLPPLPGIGFEGKSDLYKEMKSLSD